MVTLVLVKNPFSPQDGREVRYIEAQDFTVSDLLEENRIVGTELQATVNGYSVDDNTVIQDGDFVVIYPIIEKGKGGKGILGIIAAIALSVVAFGVGGIFASGMPNGAAAGMWAAGSSYFTTASYAAMAAVMFIGSSLMGRFMGQKVDNGGYESDNSKATYSWGGVTTMEGQNNPIALTYGTVKSGGQTIEKHITIDDNEEFLNWLVAAGEGELTFSNIRLNDNPYGNYDEVEVTTRSGTNNQDIISWFGDTYSTKNLNYKLGSSWQKDSVPGTDTRGIVIQVEFPSGLYHYDNKGKLKTAKVDLDIQYRISGGSWTNLFKEVASNSYGITLYKNTSPGTYNFSITGATVEEDSSGEGSIRYIYHDCVIKIGNDSSCISASDIEKKKAVTVGNFRVDTSKWTAAVRNGAAHGTDYSGTITVTTGNGVGALEEKSRSAIRKQYRINKITAGEYEVRVKVGYRQYDEDDEQSASTCYWTAVSGVIYDDFIYPCVGLIGIRAKATDQLSGSPSLTFLKNHKKVWVWNPNANAYQQKNANNPAWACYDIIHQARELASGQYEVRGAPKERMRYQDFADWAAECNTKKRYVNIEINTSGEVLDVCNQKIAPIGHGMVVRFGTKYGCIFDHAQDPVQMFGMGNIVSGTYSEEFLKVADRANCVEVTFTNADADYERDVLTVYGDTFNTDGYAKTAQLTMDGITSYEQAYREGKYQLACNKYQLRTITFEADIDSIACTVGDVILVAHDVPKWAYSGRIEEVNGLTMKLPCYVNTAGNYRIQWRTCNVTTGENSGKDILYTRNCTIVSSTEDGWTTIRLASGYPADDPPQAGDVFDLAIANVGSKPFIVKGITRSQEFRRRISAIEYAEALYDENYNIPAIEYSMLENQKPKNVTRLSGVQYAYTDANGIKRNIMAVSWQRPDNGGKFTVLYSTDKITWYTGVSQTEQDSVEFETPRGSAYYVKVITILGLRQSSGTISELIPVGVDTVPPDVTRMNVEQMANGLRRFWWEFEYPTPNDIAGFRFKYTQTNRLNWSQGIPAQEGLVTSQPYETMMIRQGYNVVMVKAVDNAGQESENFAYCILDMGDLLEENVLWTKDFSTNGTWDDVTYTGGEIIDGHIVSQSNSTYMWSEYDDFRWTERTDYAWGTTRYVDLTVETVFTAQYSGQFWIKADIDGPGVIYYQKSHSENNWTYPENARWHSGEARWTLYWDMEKQWSDKIIVKAGDVIRIKVVGISDGVKRTTINSLMAYIDVPYLFEHFEDLEIPATGKQLDIKTPNYYTTAVRIDAIQNSTAVMVKYISRTPCVIQLIDANGTAVSGQADITWQGYQKEMLL